MLPESIRWVRKLDTLGIIVTLHPDEACKGERCQDGARPDRESR